MILTSYDCQEIQTLTKRYKYANFDNGASKYFSKKKWHPFFIETYLFNVTLVKIRGFFLGGGGVVGKEKL